MKKYLKLTTREAISHFIQDGTLAPETSAEIREKLADLADLRSGISVSLVIPTHRVRPDMEKDPIVLKNCIDSVEKDLLAILNKREVWPIMENLRETEEAVHYTDNLDSLVVYANEYFSSAVKLPICLSVQTSICKYFDTTPLYKSMQQNRRYYVLTVSRQIVRLIEAFNDKAVAEITTDNFPFVKNFFYTAFNKPAEAGFEERMEKEFYNDADKSFRSVYNRNPMPVVIGGDVKSVAYYEGEMDDSSMVIGRVPGSFDTMPLHEIMAAVSPEVAKYRDRTLKEYLAAVDSAQSAGLLVTDLRDIMRQSGDGAAATLYIGNNFTLRTRQEGDMEPSEYVRSRFKADDTLFGLLADVTHKGGNIVFLDDEAVSDFGGIVMIRRF